MSKDTVFYLTAKDAENWYPITQTDTLVFEPAPSFNTPTRPLMHWQLIVEQVSGMKWQTFIEQNIMQPSGMTLSTITDGPHPESGVSHGYVLNAGKWTEDDYGEEPTFPAAGNGGVWSSIEELAKYELALQKAVFIKPATLSDSRSVKVFPNWSGNTKPFIGWSWFIDKTTDSLATIGHTGSQGGYLCNYVTLPQKQILFIILCNTPRDVPGYTGKIMSWLKEENYCEPAR